MPEALEPARASLEPTPAFKGVIKRSRKPGVAQSGIFSHLARVKKLAKIATLQRITPVFQTRKNIEHFVADFRERQPAAKTVLAKKADKPKKTDWQKMEMVLPTGKTVSEGQVIPSAGSLSAGSPFSPSNVMSTGQVIPPFEAPALEESAFTRRMKQLSEGKSSEKPQPKKRITPQSRLYSKVVEMNPRKPEQDEDLPDSMPQMDTPIPEPRQMPPVVQHARPDQVQRMPEEPSQPKSKQVRLRPAPIQRTTDIARPSAEPPARETAQTKLDTSEPAKKSDPSVRPAEKSKMNLPVWQPREAHPELRRLSPLRKEMPAKQQPEGRQSTPQKLTAQKRQPTEPAQPEAKAVEQADKAVKPSPVIAQHPQPAVVEPKIDTSPVEKPDKPVTQTAQPTTTQPKTEMPLILKPRIRSMKQAAAPTVIQPHATVPLNVIRRIPEKPVQTSKTFTVPSRVQATPRTNRLTAEPSTGKAEMPIRQAGLSQQPVQNPEKSPRSSQVELRREPQREPRRESAARPTSPRLILPLQQTVKENTSRPLSRLTVLRSQPKTIRREPEPKIVRQPAAEPAQPADRPLAMMATPQPLTQESAQNRTPERELSHQPVITRQVKTFSQAVRQRAENRLSTPAKSTAPATPATQSASALLSMQAAAILSRSESSGNIGNPVQTGKKGIRRQAEPGLGKIIQREADDKPKPSHYITDEEANEDVNELHGPGGYETGPITPPNNNQGNPPSSSQYYRTEQQDQDKDNQPVYLQRGNSSPHETNSESSSQTRPEPSPAPYELQTMYEPEMPPPAPPVESSPAVEPEVYQISKPSSQEKSDASTQLNYGQIAKDLLPIIKKMLALERERTVRR